MTSLPAALKWRASAMSSPIAVTTVKTPSMTTGSYQSGEQVIFQLPQNSIIDLKSVRLHFKLKATAVTQAVAMETADQIIARLDQSVSGINVSSVNHYGYVVGRKRLATASSSDRACNPRSYSISKTLASIGDTYTVVVKGLEYGLLAATNPHLRYLDTGLMKNTQLNLTLANLAAATGASSLEVAEVWMQADTVAFADNGYREALAADVNQANGLELRYVNAVTRVSPTVTGSTDFAYALNTRCLDRVLAWCTGSAFTSTKAQLEASSMDATSEGYIMVADKRLHASNLSLAADEYRQQLDKVLGMRGAEHGIRSELVTDAAFATDFACLAAGLALPGTAAVSGWNTMDSDGNVLVSVTDIGSSKVLVVANEVTSSLTLLPGGGTVVQT